MAKTVTNADVDLDSAASLPQRITAELFGTFVLVSAVVGTAIFTSPKAGILPIALAVGLAVIVSAYAVGHISGGHFNPAVTLGAAAAGRFAWKETPYYILAQIVGGALGATFIYVLLVTGPAGSLDAAVAGRFAANGYDAGSLDGYGLIPVIVTEVVLTAVFLYVILGVTDRRAASGFAPLAIGLTLVVIHLIAIPVSGASVNPARSIASALFGGPEALGQVWVFIVAPIVGAVIAGFTYGALFDRKKA